jgi:hypothetical protein
MEIENTSLWSEVTEVINSDSNTTSFVKAVVHAPSIDLNYPCFRLMELDVQCDFISNYTDYMVVNVLVPLGDYSYYIYPQRDNLELTISKTPVNGILAGTAASYVSRYKAFLIDTNNPQLNIAASSAPSLKDLNQKGYVSVQFQLLDILAYHLRAIEVGGIWRGSTVENVVKSVMTNESQRALIDTKLTLQGVDMVPSPNTVSREHILIPQGTRLVDLPTYVQNHAGGLYTAGLGYYLYNGYWYIYPAYDATRINTTTRSITVINIPENKMPNIDRTYTKKGSSITILATGEIKYNDDRRSQQQNAGNGIRYTNPNKLMGDFYRAAGNKADTQQTDHTNEFIVDKAKDGWVKAPIAADRITANNYKMLSQLAARRGAFITLKWDHSDPTLIKPGLLAKIYYIANGNVRSINGVIVAAHHFTHAVGQGISSSSWNTSSAITFFTEGLAD